MRQQDLRRYIPYLYGGSIVALLVAGAWYVINRQFDLGVQIALALAILASAAAVLIDPERVQMALTGRQARYGSNALLLVIAFAGILSVANYLAYTNPQRIDLTEDQQYTLAPESAELLRDLQSPVRIRGFFTPDAAPSRDNLRPLLDEYVAVSGGKLSYEFINPLENPVITEQLGVTRDRSLVITIGEESEVVTVVTEREITSAILRLTNPGERKLLYLVGHGERTLDAADEASFSQFEQALQAKNYTLEPRNLEADPEIGSDILAVIVAGPTVALAESETAALKAYQEAGGAMIVFLDPSAARQEGAEPDPLIGYVQETWGVQVRDDLVVDLSSTLPLTGIASQYAVHPITERLGNLATYFPSARSLSPPPIEEQTDTIVMALVETSSNSWGETDLQAFLDRSEIEYNEEVDTIGPLTLAVAGENLSNGARIVVFSDSDFAANADFFGRGNGDLAINSVDWAAGQEELINLTPKPATSRFVLPPSVQAIGVIFLVTLVLIPGGVVGYGVFVWWRRRRRI